MDSSFVVTCADSGLKDTQVRREEENEKSGRGPAEWRTEDDVVETFFKTLGINKISQQEATHLQKFYKLLILLGFFSYFI